MEREKLFSYLKGCVEYNDRVITTIKGVLLPEHRELLSDNFDRREEEICGIPCKVYHSRSYDGFCITITCYANDVAGKTHELGKELRSWVQCEVRAYRLELIRKEKIKEELESYLIF